MTFEIIDYKLKESCINSELDEFKIAVLACYIPLFKVTNKISSIAKYDGKLNSFKDLINLQVHEPIEDREIASSLNKPFIAVNHLEGHALSPKLNGKLDYPYLLLLISGGHTQFLSVNKLGEYKRLGTTIDDAVGEAFDKTAKMLGIEFPGGPQIEVYAKKGDPDKYKLPKPIFHRGGCNLSFAGLKTAVLKITKQIKNDNEKYDLAASFQKTIEEILYQKTKVAFKEFKNINGDKSNTFVVAGGVAANKKIRETLTKLCEKENFNAIFPPISLCGDNAAMIAMVGLEKFKMKEFDNLDYPAKPRWALDNEAKFLKGAGVKL